MKDEFIFVYGTLRKAFALAMYDKLLRCSEYYADGTMQGKLFDVGGYPGAIASSDPNEKVYGELYRILRRSRLMVLLDDYEECSKRFARPHEYRRKHVPISFGKDRIVMAWVYMYNRDTARLKQICSGDYVRYRHDNRLV